MEKKSVYSICKIVLPVPISCSYPKLELNMVHGHIQTPKSPAVDTLVWSTSSFLSKRTLSYCILTKDFVQPYVAMN